jgi:hypothetical protein
MDVAVTNRSDSRHRITLGESVAHGVGSGPLHDTAGRSERVSLSREYSVLLVELAIALHKHAIYPEGHPALRPAAEGVARRAGRLLGGREQLSFGVAQQQLIIDGVATDPGHPVLQRLAATLHRHQLAALTIVRGVEAGEVGEALRALGAEPERTVTSGVPAALPTWPHLKLHPLTFDRLTLLSDAPAVVAEGPTRGLHGTELWLGLARAAIAVEGDAPLEAEAIEPVAVARAIDDHPSAPAYDQVIVGHLLQIAEELRDASGAEAAALRRRTARLIANLKPDTLRRLVEMGGDAAQRTSFVLDATHGMAVESVLAIVQAAADTGGQTISHGLSRMLAKLAAHAEHADEQVRAAADEALREQVGRLITGWELDDPNPGEYSRTLQHLAASPRRPSGTPAGDDIERHDPVRLVQMALELGSVGPRARVAIGQVLAEGRVGEVLAALSSPPAEADEASREILAQLMRPASIQSLVALDPIDVASLDALLPSLPAEGYDVLIDTVIASDDRLKRRQLLERLALARIDILPRLAAHLNDERWFVQRNMLWLMERIGRVPDDYDAAEWMAHSDARVRLQAIRLHLSRPADRDAALAAALGDVDPRIRAAGCLALQSGYTASLLPDVLRIAEADEDEDLRALAVRMLGRSPEPIALRALLERVDGGRSWTGRAKLAPRSPIVLSALAALADGWSHDPRAAAALTVGARSSDPDIAAAARGESQ